MWIVCDVCICVCMYVYTIYIYTIYIIIDRYNIIYYVPYSVSENVPVNHDPRPRNKVTKRRDGLDGVQAPADRVQIARNCRKGPRVKNMSTLLYDRTEPNYIFPLCFCLAVSTCAMGAA